MTKIEIVKAISNVVAEFRADINAHNGDLTTPREEIVQNCIEFFSEINRRFSASVNVIDGGFTTTIDGIRIEFIPKWEFIRIGGDEFVSTHVGDVRINEYIAECMKIALWGVLS